MNAPRLENSLDSKLDAGLPLSTDFDQQDLQTVLEAWHTATDRLQQTHLTLCDEVRRLSDELEVKNQELARENRLADLGRMASCVAHEVRNCLTPITLYMSLLRRRLPPEPEVSDIVEKLNSCFHALEATVDDLLQFTGSRQPTHQVCLVRNLVQEVYQSLAPQCMAQGIRMQLDLPPAETVSCDREMIRRVLMNLVLNAIDAMPDGGDLFVTSCQTSRGFELEIADSGPGLDSLTLTKALDPFYTTKEGGTGLGLAIVGRIMEVHGGAVEVSNCPEGGAAFTLRFPGAAMEAAA